MAKKNEEKHIVVSTIARETWDKKKREHDYKKGKTTQQSEFLLIVLENFEVKI